MLKDLFFKKLFVLPMVAVISMMTGNVYASTIKDVPKEIVGFEIDPNLPEEDWERSPTFCSSLQQCVKDGRTTRTISIKSSEITNANVEKIKTYERLYITIDQYDDDSLNRIVQVAKKVHAIRFSNAPITDSIVTHLGEFPNLKHLIIADARVTNDHFAKLATLTNLANLEGLDVFGNIRLDSGLMHLKKFPNLVELNIGRTAAQSNDLAHLQSLPQLKRLTIVWKGNVGTGLKHLKGIKLEYLNLFGSNITANDLSVGFSALKDLKSLKTLNLGITKTNDLVLSKIKELKGLETLDLMGTEITKDGLVHLKDLKNLKELSVRSTAIQPRDLIPLNLALPKLKIKQ